MRLWKLILGILELMKSPIDKLRQLLRPISRECAGIFAKAKDS